MTASASQPSHKIGGLKMATNETYEEFLACYKKWASSAISNQVGVQEMPKKKPKPQACLTLVAPRAKSNLDTRGVIVAFKPIRIIKQPSPTH
jgi:hypothetical protein